MGKMRCLDRRETARISLLLCKMKTIQVCPVQTVASDAVLADFEVLLSDDERERAERFRFEHLRRSFILGRGSLRVLLGHRLHVEPEAIHFEYGARGKPRLATPATLHFNASQSGDFALFAFTSGCELGIDVERTRSMPDLKNIADRFFCREEAAELMALPPEEREAAFFRCWTRKEAYIKAVGDGLAIPLDSFRVSLHEPARFLHFGKEEAPAQSWTLHNLQLADGFAAALAYRDQPRELVISAVTDPSGLRKCPPQPRFA